MAQAFSPLVVVTVTLKSPSPSSQSVTGAKVTAPVPPPPALSSGQGMTGRGIVRSKSKSKVYSQAEPFAHGLVLGVTSTVTSNAPVASVQSSVGAKVTAPLPPTLAPIVGQGITGLGIVRSKSKSSVYWQEGRLPHLPSVSCFVSAMSAVKEGSPSLQSSTGSMRTEVFMLPARSRSGQGITGGGI